MSNRGVVMARLSEILLMKAEAQAMTADDAGAKATLNQLLAARTVSGATPLTCDTYAGMSGLTTMQMVQLQTRIEMWGERGLEWYNNRRWGIDVNRAGSANHWNTSMTYPVADMTLQIPDSEIQTNSLLQQNQ